MHGDRPVEKGIRVLVPLDNRGCLQVLRTRDHIVRFRRRFIHRLRAEHSTVLSFRDLFARISQPTPLRVALDERRPPAVKQGLSAKCVLF